MKALWDDIKFSTTHCTKIERIALVGEKTWEKWWPSCANPSPSAKIQLFDADQIDEARKWISGRVITLEGSVSGGSRTVRGSVDFRCPHETGCRVR